MAVVAVNNAPARLQRTGWQAHLRLGYTAHDDRTVVSDRRHEGPLRVQRPFHPEGAPCHSYLLHPPGGVVGGDGLDVDIDVGPKAWTVITSPGATKFYRSLGGEARVEQRIRVAPDGVIEWLPQEQIAFPGAIVSSRTCFELAPDAHLVGWELNCFGRPASTQPFDHGRFRQRLEVWRGDTPVLLEHACLDGGGMAMAAPWGLGGHQAMATLVASPAGADDIKALREALVGVPGEVAVTGFDDLLVLRWRGPGALEGYQLRARAWELLRPRLLDRPACPPRIWNT
ncbi:urease accessory protein UreD [Spiribacter onubensis]|uniref:Urease accessory protein UreD n=1 Tax=Spiribacter onubensis TaxID=3122420 RepID=A0ABV3S9S3_9GAMM